MGWATVEWPPENGTGLTRRSKTRKKLLKYIVVAIISLLILSMALICLAWIYPNAKWPYPAKIIQLPATKASAYLQRQFGFVDKKKNKNIEQNKAALEAPPPKVSEETKEHASEPEKNIAEDNVATKATSEDTVSNNEPAAATNAASKDAVSNSEPAVATNAVSENTVSNNEPAENKITPVQGHIRINSSGEVSRGESFRYTNVLEMVATAYTHTGNPTASGAWPCQGVVAVDQNVIPLGSKLYIEGYGYARAMDTGSSIVGNRIDLFMDSREQALNWGVKRVKVYVLEN